MSASNSLFLKFLSIVLAVLLMVPCTASLAACSADSILSTPEVISAEIPAALVELTQQLEQFYGEPTIAHNGDRRALCYSLPDSQLDDVFDSLTKETLTKVIIDIEHKQLVLEYRSEPEKAMETAVNDDVVDGGRISCSYCHGTRICGYCR